MSTNSRKERLLRLYGVFARTFHGSTKKLETPINRINGKTAFNEVTVRKWFTNHRLVLNVSGSVTAREIASVMVAPNYLLATTIAGFLRLRDNDLDWVESIIKAHVEVKK